MCGSGAIGSALTWRALVRLMPKSFRMLVLSAVGANEDTRCTSEPLSGPHLLSMGLVAATKDLALKPLSQRAQQQSSTFASFLIKTLARFMGCFVSTFPGSHCRPCARRFVHISWRSLRWLTVIIQRYA